MHTLLLALLVVGYFLSGILAIFVGGICDRLHKPEGEGWPTGLVLILGYFGLGIVLAYLILGVGLYHLNNKFLQKVYELGKGDK